MVATWLVAWVFSLVFFQCAPGPKPIDYGQDKCEFCRMSIVDQRYGCELVTAKSKALKFDATECMINYLDDNVNDESGIRLILTNTLDDPGKLVEVQNCIYLKSKNMPSPMGAFINPFLNYAQAKNAQDQNTGALYDWEALRAELAGSR
ncbi:MAG: hypothetical protein HC819_13030 [Cyclobacteriaceae bacterium]|nr:hypothetical protein [Cyclobacteriaceae bacterium]